MSYRPLYPSSGHAREALIERYGVDLPGLDFGPGWAHLIAEFLAAAERSGELHDLRFAQIKEKMGGLRIHAGPCSQNLADLKHELENRSLEICEHCGGRGKLRQEKVPYRTLCDACDVAFWQRVDDARHS